MFVWCIWHVVCWGLHTVTLRCRRWRGFGMTFFRNSEIVSMSFIDSFVIKTPKKHFSVYLGCSGFCCRTLWLVVYCWASRRKVGFTGCNQHMSACLNHFLLNMYLKKKSTRNLFGLQFWSIKTAFQHSIFNFFASTVSSASHFVKKSLKKAKLGLIKDGRACYSKYVESNISRPLTDVFTTHYISGG